MNRGRILPLVGPAAVLYLAAEVFGGGAALDPAGMALMACAGMFALVPTLLGRGEDVEGSRRLGMLSMLLAVSAVCRAKPHLLSLPLEIGSALSEPFAAAILVDLALDLPDRPTPLARAGWLRKCGYAAAAICAAMCFLLAMPPIEVFGQTLLLPATLSSFAAVFAVAGCSLAAGLRFARRSLGSSPEALASNSWALLSTSFAGIAGWIALGSVSAALSLPSSFFVRGLLAASLVALVLGHYAMLDSRRPIGAARAARRIVAAVLAIALMTAGASWWVPKMDPGAIGIGLFVAGTLVLGSLAYRAFRVLVDVVFAPDSGFLLRAIEESDRSLISVRTIEEVAAAALGPLRQAVSSESAPELYTIAPPRCVSVDSAGMPRVEKRGLPEVVLTRLEQLEANVLVSSPLAAMVVRRPDLRPLVDALDHWDAMCVVPIAAGGELEGALVIPRGKRRAPMTLEELAALERLAARLSGPLAMFQAEARAQQRSAEAASALERMEEKLDALEVEIARLRREAATLRGTAIESVPNQSLVAYSEGMKELLGKVETFAPVDAPLHVMAEGGEALEMVARLLHLGSARREGPLVVGDCASIRPESSAAALLGSDEADAPRDGWLRAASGGTLLLLDVPALSLSAQAALAEAIATRTARAEGGLGSYAVDVRVVCHSRLSLSGLVELGAFDAELTRRIEPLSVRVPPLRERREDLHSLILYALDRACRMLGRPVLGIDDDAMAHLCEYEWPGNEKELEAVVERAVAAADGPRVALRDLPMFGESAQSPVADPLAGTWNEIEQRVLLRALAQSSGNKSEAARLLGLPRTTFLDKLRRTGLEVADSSIPPAR